MSATSNKFFALDSLLEKVSQAEPLFGRCNGRFSLISVTSDFAQGLLPPDLQLAPQNYMPEGQHPILLMFNDTWLHSNPFLERIAKDNHLDLNLHYNEFIVMLPYVEFRNEPYKSEGSFCFLPVLYLDSLMAVLGGRIFWEFNKEMAHFSIEGSHFNVSHEITRQNYFKSQFSLSGMAVLGNTISNFESIAPILNLPVLEYGELGYVTSIYKVNYQNEYIIPFDLQLTNHSSPYLPKISFNSPSILTQPMGSFSMQYEWSLTYANFIKF